MIDATSRFHPASVAALIVVAILLGGAAPSPTSAPAAPGERNAATASVTPPGTPSAVATPATVKGVVVAVGGGQMRRGAGAGDGTGGGGGDAAGRAGGDGKGGGGSAGAGRGGGDGKGRGGGDGAGRGGGDGKGRGGRDGAGRGGGDGKGRGSGDGSGRGGGNQMGRGDKGAGRGDGSGGGKRSEVSEGGRQRRVDGRRLRRGQILLSVDGGEMLVEVGRGAVPGNPPIAAGDEVSVTGLQTMRGSRKVIRATRIVRGSETYEIKPTEPRVRSTPRRSVTPAPTEGSTR